MTILASVVVPTYNGAAYIEDALASIFAQTAPPTEVIVVDDCSTDGTADLVEALARTAPVPLRLIRCERNSGGPARPMNLGVAAAAGDLVAVVDQDDVLLPTKLERQVEALRKTPEAQLAFSLCGRLGGSGEPILPPDLLHRLSQGGRRRDGFSVFDGLEMLRFFMAHGCITIGFPGLLFRKEAWRLKGGFDGGFRIGADYDFICWAARQAAVVYIPEIHYLRREHNQNLCNSQYRVILDMARVKARYLRLQPSLTADSGFISPVKDEFFWYAYRLRNLGRYADALRCHLLYATVWGADTRCLLGVLKLAPHWVRSRLRTVRVPELGASAR